MNTNSQLLFAPDDMDFKEDLNESTAAWKIAIVDDDILVHQVTKMVLEDFKFDGLPIKFLSAYSAKEGYQLFKDHDDIAVCILDVIMETDTAGIELAHDIRGKLNNTSTRIVLRTGQPGLSIEEELISKYNINDYKTKTELTSSKLRTLIISCIRTYIEMQHLKRSKAGMEKIIRTISKIVIHKNINVFAQEILVQIPSIINTKKGEEATPYNGLVAYKKDNSTKIVASISSQSDYSEHDISNILPHKVLDLISENKSEFVSELIDGDYIALLTKEDDTSCLVFLKSVTPFDDIQQELLSVYLQNIMETLTNIFIN